MLFSTKFQAALLLVLVSLSFSASGLKCYNCQWTAGSGSSDCKSNLRDDFLYDVPANPGVRSSTSRNETTKQVVQMLNMTSPKAADDVPSCWTISGKKGGVEVVIRSGGYIWAALARRCADETSPGVATTTCYCDTDACNDDAIDDGSGDGGGGNGATATALNVALAIVGATFTLFKLHA